MSMKRKAVLFALALGVSSGGFLATPAYADGKIACGGGPRANWTSVEKLKAQLIAQGWTIKKAKPTRDCYEVYGKTPEGDNVESSSIRCRCKRSSC